MTDKSLSQEEINALMGNNDNSTNEESLTDEQKDALGEIGNISFGSSATALSELLRNKTEINTPTVTITTLEEIENDFDQPYVSIKVEYIEGIRGENVLLMNMKDAAIIADLMMDGDGTNVDETNIGELEISAVQEAMNQMMGKSATSMSMIFNKKVDISPPETKVLGTGEEEVNDHIPQQSELAKVAFRLKIGDLIDSEVMMLIDVDFAKELVDNLLNAPEEKAEEEVLQETSPAPEPSPSANQAKPAESKPQNQPPIQNATFSDFSPSTSNQTGNSLDLLYDIPLQVSVELGRTKRSIQEILDLSKGSIIELDRLAGEHVDILVNDKLIAKGEVVVIEENFGVRVTDILSPKDRMKKIK